MFSHSAIRRVGPRWAVTLSAALLLAACEDGRGPLDPQRPGETPVAVVEVTPGQIALTVGQSRSLAAVARAGDGTELKGRSLQWSSADEAIATVDGTGRVTALAAGTVEISASSGGRTGRATLVVSQKPVASVAILGEPEVVLEGGKSVQLIAIARDAEGNDLQMRVPAWSSSDERVAWVSSSGGVVAGGAGTAIITATVEEKTAQVTVRVHSLVQRVEVSPGSLVMVPHDGRTLTAKVLGANGQVLQRAVEWKSANEAVATVDQRGRVISRGVGSTLITATADGKVATVAVLVAEWQRHDLRSVQGKALPAVLWSGSYVDDEGVTHTVQATAVGGELKVLGGSRYSWLTTIQLYEDGKEAGTTWFSDHGDVMYDMWTGDLILKSEVHEELGTVRGQRHSDGRYTLRRRLIADGEELIFQFAAP